MRSWVCAIVNPVVGVKPVDQIEEGDVGSVHSCCAVTRTQSRKKNPPEEIYLADSFFDCMDEQKEESKLREESQSMT